MARDGELVDLESTFSLIASELFESGSVAETLQRIVALAERAIEGCDAAGVLVFDGATPSTAAASRPLAVELDRLQILAGGGPCIDASMQGSTFYAEDLADDPRWPTFSPAAQAVGIRSILAYSLTTTRPSALNLYARYPAAFGATDRAQGQLFATLARLALDSATERAADEVRASNLTEALRSRELIGQAQGILMERERITADQAFDVLRRASQQVNIKLREIAQTLVETGEAPNLGRTRPPR